MTTAPAAPASAVEAVTTGPGAVTTAARAVVATLAGHGVDRVFCVAGESYLAVLDALYDEPAIDVVTCRHEGSAGFAAVADAKLSRRAGVVLVNRGPGATNASIAVHAAWQDATPLVLIVGHVRRAEIGRDVFQELDCEKTFAGMAKGVWTVYEPARVAEVLARALRVAQAGTPGPTVVVLPEDVLNEPSGPGVIWPAVQHPPMPDPAAVRRVAAMLDASARPLVIVGDRLGDPAGRSIVARFAHAWTAPVVVSNKRQDLFANDDPHYAGHLTIATRPAQRDLLAQADLVLAVGTRLDSITTQGHRLPGAPLPDQPLVHVYPDAGRLGRVHTPTIAITADPATFLAALAEQAPATGARRLDWVGRLHEAHRAQTEWHPVTAADGVVFGAVVTTVDRLAAADALFTVDAGNFTSWVHRHLVLTAGRRLLGIASSAMGFGVPSAVAAALREPGRQVIAFVGDGGFLMTGTELATAVARRARLVVVIADNGSYGTIRQHQERTYPGRVIATDLANPDFGRLAEAFGARGLSVRDDADVAPALAEALAATGPVVVDVRTSLEWISANQRMDVEPGRGCQRRGEAVS
jgi:acetolactate synthase-1/2/3 large subunit